MAYDSMVVFDKLAKVTFINKKETDPQQSGQFGYQARHAAATTFQLGTSRAIVASSTSDLMIVGDSHYFYHFSDGVWTRKGSSISVMVLYDFSFVSDNNIWCANYRTVYYWNGTTWSADKVDTQTLFGVHYISDTDVWAVGGSSGNERVWHKTGAGWNNVYSDLPGTPGIPRAVWAADASNIYVLTNSKKVFHFDGASTWTLVHTATGDTGDNQRIWGADNSNIWVVNPDSIDYYNGSTWTNQDTGIPGSGPVDVNGISSTEVYFSCQDGAAGSSLYGLLKVYDGSSWEHISGTSIGGGGNDGFYGLHPSLAPSIAAAASSPAYNTGSAIGINRIDSDFTINNHKLSPSQVVTSNMSSVDFVPFGFGTKQLHIKTPFPQVVAAAGPSFVLKFEDNFDDASVALDTIPGNGVITEVDSDLVMTCPIGIDCSFTSGLQNMPVAYIDLSLANELSGNLVKIEAKMTSLVYSHTWAWPTFQGGMIFFNDSDYSPSHFAKTYYVSSTHYGSVFGHRDSSHGYQNNFFSDPQPIAALTEYSSVPILIRIYYNNSESDVVIQESDGDIDLELFDRDMAAYFSYDNGISWALQEKWSSFTTSEPMAYSKVGVFASANSNGIVGKFDYLKAWAYE